MHFLDPRIYNRGLMWYLYSGFVSVQLYSVINVLYNNSVSFSALFFSVIVFIIWTLLPVSAYGIAKLCGRTSNFKPWVLIVLGVFIGLSEKFVFHLGLFGKDEFALGMLAVFVICFALAYVPNDKVFASFSKT